ncbi:MAG: hypothetical protein UY63_C0008G0019 [Parcubacteria group bacterium GW2011_GWA2_51_10]|nr:MAG: hypothetical protein UY63_C0008G0019 [Parcubacteria group bacterium GW2011_GWA2_51_10]
MADCTYVIPTYNRIGCLARHLRYLKRQNWKAPILIADSSLPEKVRENAAIIKEFKDALDISHLVLSDRTAVYTKLGKALQEVRTPFVALCADDDFLVPSAIEAATLFLRDHSDYSAACGRTVVFFPDSEKLHIAPRRSITQDDPAERLTELLRDFMGILWGIYRTPDCIAAISGAEAHATQSFEGGMAYRFPELYAGCILALRGKIVMIPRLLSVRETPGTHELYPNRIYGWPAIFVHKGFSNEYERFRVGLSEVLSEKSELPLPEAAHAIDAAFLLFMRNVLHRRRSTREKLRDIFDTQWFRILLRAQTPQEYFVYELKAPLRALRRFFSEDWRQLRIIRSMHTSDN